MYRITDPHTPDLGDRIRQAVEACLAQYPDSSAYALIDPTLVADWGALLWQAAQDQPDQVQSVYQDTPLAELEACSLFLARVARKDLEQLLERGQAGPVLSFVQTTLSLEQLRQHLACFARARTPDGKWLLARWGCTVVAPVLVKALTPAQKSRFLGGFAAWYLINRKGQLDIVNGSMDAPSAAADLETEGMLEYGYAVDDDALALVADASEADVLLHALGTQQPHALGDRPASMLHSMARQVLARMREAGIPEGVARLELLARALQQPSAQASRALIQGHP
ncbi:DUF4123 domain-containing protein [Rhodoferax aquaticus]|nr:DUF4123 domain-containing protein [Rhodoferax aquaticus]